MDLFEQQCLEAAKACVDQVFKEALQQIGDRNRDPSDWFWKMAVHRCQRLPLHPWFLPLPAYHEWLQYFDDAHDWLRLNHPQPGVPVPCGVWPDSNLSIH